MMCLLLSLSLALTRGVQAAHVPQTAEHLDIRKVTGTWHPVAVAASDVLLLDAESGPLRVYVEELKPTPEGDLETLLQKRENHKCVEKTLMAQKTEDPAVFTVDYHGERKISVLDTGYSSCVIFCVEGPMPTDEGSAMCQCLGTWRPCRACLEELHLTETGLLVELTLEVDNEAMGKFAGALELLQEDVQMVLDLCREAEQCHV